MGITNFYFLKRIIFSALVVAGALLSCEKTNFNNSQVHDNSEEFENLVKANGRVWFDNGNIPGVDGVDYGCAGSGGKCLPEVVVTASIANLVNDFGNTDEPVVFAEDNYADLSTIISTDDLDEVINSNYSVTLRSPGSSTTTGYIVFKDADEAVQSVYVFRN